MFRDAFATLRAVTRSDAFRKGHPQQERNSEEWRYFKPLLLDADGNLAVARLEGVGESGRPVIMEMGGRKLQKVLVDALMQQLWTGIVTDPTVHDNTRTRLRQCAQYGSGTWHQIMCVTKDTELQPNLFIIPLQRRLGAPISIVGPDTRCVGECKLYTKSALPRLLPCKIGNGRNPRTLHVREHEDAVHWESEGSKGLLHGRHQMVSKAVEAILSQLGYTAKTIETFVGKQQGGNEAWQKIDGVATSWDGGTSLGWDSVVISALNNARVRRSARDGTCTDALARCENGKRKLKEYPTRQTGRDFLVAAMDTFSAMGPQLCEFTMHGFERRKEQATTKRDRWQVSMERDICVARLSAAVQRGTAIILLKNAAPLNGYSEFPELVPLDANEGERLWGAAGT